MADPSKKTEQENGKKVPDHPLDCLKNISKSLENIELYLGQMVEILLKKK